MLNANHNVRFHYLMHPEYRSCLSFDNYVTMKHTITLLLGTLIFCTPIDAQQRVIDAIDHSPVSAASIFDASGNMVGYTLSDGTFSEIPESAYPITLRCIAYEQLIVERAEDKTWEMTPSVYNLEELVIVPVKRNILKQTFYVREYFSMSNSTDTVTFFTEHMADRFVPTSKDAKFGRSSSLRILKSRHYSHYQLFGEDSVGVDTESPFPSMLTIIKLNEGEVTAPESFKESDNPLKLNEKAGKSGKVLIQKQNAHTFTTIEGLLAENEEHKVSPWPLKLLGITMEFNQLYITHAYRVNDKGVYLPNDLMEASLVMVADGRGKFLRKALKSDKPIVIRCMIELYSVDNDYLSKKEAKDEYKNKPTDVKFVIPSTVPPLNGPTQRLVERANTETKIKN